MEHETSALLDSLRRSPDPKAAPNTDYNAEEQHLVAAARQNRGAFTPLYRRYALTVYHYLYAQTGHQQDAEDLAETTFSKALANLEQYSGRESFAAWLFGIARHTLHDHQRKRRPHTTGVRDSAACVDPVSL